jgi:hypothetical protein
MRCVEYGEYVRYCICKQEREAVSGYSTTREAGGGAGYRLQLTVVSTTRARLGAAESETAGL